MGATSGIGSGAAGPWYRVQAILADGRQGASAERDYASVLPAVLNAAMHRRPFIAGWLSRGGGAPLELITNAGPLPPAGPQPDGEIPAEHALRPGAGAEMLFPWGGRGVPVGGNMLADLDQLVWAPCPGRQVPLAAQPANAPAAAGLPTLFETAL